MEPEVIVGTFFRFKLEPNSSKIFKRIGEHRFSARFGKKIKKIFAWVDVPTYLGHFFPPSTSLYNIL